MLKWYQNSKIYLKSFDRVKKERGERVKIVLFKDVHETPIKIFHRAVESTPKSLIKEGSQYYIDSIEWYLLRKIEFLKGQLIDEFGVSPEAEMLYYKKCEVLNWEIKLLEGDRSAETFLMIAKQQEEQLIKMMGVDKYDAKKGHAMARLAFIKEFHTIDDNLSMYDFYFAIHEIMSRNEEVEFKENLRDHG